MVSCGNCGSTVPEGAGTCPQCGVELAGGSSSGPNEADSGGASGDESHGAESDRMISSEEAESGTTRIYGLSGAEEDAGAPPADPEAGEAGEAGGAGEAGEAAEADEAGDAGEAAAVEGSTTKVTKTDDGAAVGPEARDPPPGSRPTRGSPEERDGANRRRILAGIGVVALGASGLYAVLGRSGGGDDSSDGQNTADGDGPADTSDGESDSSVTDSDGSGGSSETDDTDGEDSTGEDDQSSGDVADIDMGILMGVSGGLEQLGPPIRDGAELVARQINQADTHVSVDTRFEDTGTDQSQGISGAEALIDAGYPMICGALASDVSIAVAESAAIPNGIPMNSPSSTAPGYTAMEGDFTFRTATLDSFQGQALAEIARHRLGADTAAVLAQDDAYGLQLSEGFIESFQNTGGTITDQVNFSPGQSSYVGHLETVLYAQPDLLLVVSFPPDGVQIFRDFYAEFDRDDMPILVSDGLHDDAIPDNVGHEMTNVTGTYPLQEGPGLDFFRELYEQTYGVDPTTKIFTQQGYDAAATLVLAQAAAGEKDGTAIRDQIRPVTDPGGTEVGPENLVEGVELAAAGEEIEYRGASGEVQYDDRGDQSAATYAYFGFDAYGDIERIDTIQL